MAIKKTIGEKLFDAANSVFMVFLIFITIYPFWYVITCSFSDSAYLIGDKGIMLKPHGFSLESYKMVFNNPNILTGYINTIIIVVFGTLINVFMTSIGAFVLSRRDFAIKKPLMVLILITMYFGGGLIPTFLWINNILGMKNTFWALLLPGAISTYNLIVMRTNFASIPVSLEEAAKIDGANDIHVLFKVVLPLSIPILAVMTLFYGVGHWNSWFSALIYIRDRSKYPLQLILREIILLNNTDAMATNTTAVDKFNVGEGIKYATIIVATVPILCIYPFIQKYFVKGVMVGAIKE